MAVVHANGQKVIHKANGTDGPAIIFHRVFLTDPTKYHAKVAALGGSHR